MNNAAILIVEDDGMLALLLKEILSRVGYTISGVLDTGEKAIDFIPENSVDLILMDIELAGEITGITAAEEIQKISDIPVVFLTSYSQEVLVEQAKSAAPYGYLIKPVSERDLVATLETALYRHDLDRKLRASRIALQKSEAQYRNLFENSPLGIFRTTLDGRPLAVNAEMARILGCSSPEETIKEFGDLEARLYVDPGRRREFISLLRRDGVVNNFEYEGRMKNGEKLWISMNARLTSVDNEQPGGWVIDGFATDITGQKKAAEALRESEQNFRTLADHGQALVWTSGTDKLCNYFNRIWLEFTGRSLEQELGDGWVEGVHPDDLQRCLDIYNDAFDRREKFSMVYRLRRHDGEYRWILDDGCPRYNTKEEFIGYIGHCLDITSYRRTEENYQTLFNKMLDGFALHEIINNNEGVPVDYRFLAVNPAFEKMTGLRADDIVGRSVLDIMPGTESHWIETYGRVALTGEPVFFENTSRELKKYFQVTAYRPAPRQFACIFVDITERKRAEEEKKALQSQLQQAQKMEAIGTLAGGIAHDFNNILSAILGYAEMAHEDCPSDSQVARDLNQVIQAGHRARDLVKQILAISRQAATQRISLQPADIVNEAITLLRSSLPATIEINHDVDPESGCVFADPTQVHQVLMNLCTNAFHAMEASGGVLTITLKKKVLSPGGIDNYPGLNPGNYVHLSVGDNGPGISPEIQERIFDPYFTTKETGKGTGLGLAIVHGIIKSYGGSIRCRSLPGQGTVFEILLPAMEESVLPESQPVGPLPRGCERILYIDDEAMLADMGQTMLEKLGYKVTTRTSSIDALALFKSKPDDFDLVLTDQTMPEMTGMDLARNMLQIRPHLPIILCTGYSNLISAEKAKSIGIKGFALKPIAKKDIAFLIRRALDSQQRSR